MPYVALEDDKDDEMIRKSEKEREKKNKQTNENGKRKIKERMLRSFILFIHMAIIICSYLDLRTLPWCKQNRSSIFLLQDIH